jgi:hypothetical protein
MTDMTVRDLFIEEIIINALKFLFLGRVNEILGEAEVFIPPVEFARSPNGGQYAVTPELSISVCERTEKDRIVLLDAYIITISFVFPEKNGERNCYAYAGAAGRALAEDPSLGGAADRAELVKKEYKAPKRAGTGEPRELALTVRVTVNRE